MGGGKKDASTLQHVRIAFEEQLQINQGGKKALINVILTLGMCIVHQAGSHNGIFGGQGKICWAKKFGGKVTYLGTKCMEFW